MDNEKQIILKAQEDIGAFDYLYETYFPRIFHYVYMRTADRDIAEEIVSNVFYKAMNKLYLFRFRFIPFSAWLYRIAVSEIANYYRGVKRRKKLEKNVLNEQDTGLPPAPVKEDDPDFAFVHQYLGMLPEEDQNLIVLRYFDKKPFKEIAAITGRRESTLRVRLHRALKRLAASMPEEVVNEAIEKIS